MKPFVYFLSLFVGISVPAFGHASGPLCVDLFRDSQRLEASRVYRRQLLERSTQLLNDLRSNEDKNAAEAHAFFRSRSKITEASIRVAIQSSETLAALGLQRAVEPARALSVRPPEVLPHTMSAIEDPQLWMPYLEGILSNDPYFKWLQHNALPFKIAPERQRSFARELLGVDNYSPAPEKLFTIYRMQGLSPKMALLRVQRNLDPDVSFEARAAIDRALVFSARIMAVEEQVLSIFSRPDANPGTTEAWYQMTSLEAGRAAMADLRSRIMLQYSPLFSERAFDRLLILFRRYDPTTFFVEKFRIQRVLGKSDAAIVDEFQTEIAALRAKLNVSNLISDVRFAEVCMRAYELRFQSSYLFVLADVFETPVGVEVKAGTASNIVSSQMLVLHRLIEFGEAFKSARNLNLFIEEISRENERRFSPEDGVLK